MRLPNYDDTIKASTDLGEPWGVLEVEIKRWWSAEDQDELTNSQIRIGMELKGEGQPAQVEGTMRVGKLSLASMVVKRWNVEDATGAPMPVTRANLGLLPSTAVDWICEQHQEEQSRQKKGGASGKKT